MREKFLLSISQRLVLLFLLLLFVPVLLVSLFWCRHIFNATRSRLYTEINNIAGIITNSYHNKVNEMNLVADIVSADPSLVDYLEQEDMSFDYESYLKTTQELGPFLDNIRQANSNITAIRIWALNEQTPRYQYLIFPYSALEGLPLYETLPQIPYRSYEMMHSASLFSYQNQSNQRQLCFPVNTLSDTLTFSQFSQMYSPITHQPIAYLECIVEADTLLDVSDMNLDIEQIYIVENERVIYSYNDTGRIAGEVAALSLPSGLYDHCLRAGGQKYHFFTYSIAEPEMTLVIACPSRSVYDQSRVDFMILLSILLAFLFLFCCFTFWSYKKFFIRLELLNTRMNQLRAGDDGVVFDDLLNDEIGQINNTLSLLINKVYSVKLAENEATSSYLRAQIEPHFLFNALEAIRMTAILGDSEKVCNALMSLGALMRVRTKHQSQSTVAEEISLVQSYVQLENIRFDGRIHLQIQIEPGLDNAHMPSLMLQPLVENTVKHGMPTGSLPLHVKISITELSEEQMLVRILDNGTGIAPDRLEQIKQSLKTRQKSCGESHGVALANIARRLYLYYEGRAQLELFSTYGTGTQVTVILPRTE